MPSKLAKPLALAVLAASGTWAAAAATLEDIQFWVGSGTNRAALVVDWNDGKQPQSLLWGYRWNGTASGLDMLRAVVTNDSRLFAHVGQFVWGTAIFGLGYDLNHNGGFNTTPALSFDASGWLLETGSGNANDARVPADSNDHFVEGWNTGFWAYYTKGAWSNAWASSWVGAADRVLSDGAWDGFRFAPWFVGQPPGEPVPAAPNPFAFQVVAAHGPFGASPYDDPASLLGRPSTNFYDPWGSWSGGTHVRRVKLVESAYNLNATQTHKLITTLNNGSSIIVRFEQPITDHPAHPYGVDFLVFGNAFYSSSGLVNDSTDMSTLMLTGGGFSEPTKVSVSPGYTGAPGQDPADPTTWAWYRYDDGPYADTAFPTHAYRWNRTNATWSNELMDFTKPVNPAFGPVLQTGGLSAADAIDLYDGSGGGTGFDLAASGFAEIRYVKIEGLPGFSGGEIDALAAVRPAALGDSLTVAPGNLTNGPMTLRFQRPARPGQTALALTFTNVSEAARVSTTPLNPATELPAGCGPVLTAAQLDLAPVLSSNEVTFSAALHVGTGASYFGNGGDLVLLRREGTNWANTDAAFNNSTKTMVVSGLTNLFATALVQMQPPTLRIAAHTNGQGDPVMVARFPALPGFTYTLERSGTLDFTAAEDRASVSPAVAQEATLEDDNLPGSAFYRLRIVRISH
jgi:hypothetical protein